MRDKDFDVLVPENTFSALTLAEIEARLQQQGHTKAQIDYTLWFIATCREDLRLRPHPKLAIVQ